MLRVNSKNNKPIKGRVSNLEDGALMQAYNLANLPFIRNRVALMPDCHQGYGMPIGGVIATKGVVIPNAVGVDIGCGMCAVKTNIEADSIGGDTLKRILGKIREVVPVGFEHHKEEQYDGLMPMKLGNTTIFGMFMKNKKNFQLAKHWDSALKQLGTLGGGNHFIELQKGDDGKLWVMIHSGSRNLGKQIADHYNKIAIELNKKRCSSVPKEWDLAFLPMDSEEGKNYIAEMNYCVEFALANRKLMMSSIIEIVGDTILEEGISNTFSIEQDMINIAHNYARMENHFGENVMVHRKGATSAREGEIGIIPGSQGTCSYIVQGLGNTDSFMSCSHGAGRKMSRTEAEKTLNLEDEIALMDKQGIVHGIRNRSDLDEAPSAYKNIDEVMENQKDLVKILVKLTPLAVIKG